MNVYDLTPDFVRASDGQAWQALQVVVHDNPAYIQNRLIGIGYSDAPQEPEALFQYFYDKLNNGSMSIGDAQSAFNGAPITHPKSKSGEGNFWNDLGQVAGVVLTTLFPAEQAGAENNPNKPNNTPPKQDNTWLYVGIGVIVVILIVIVVLAARKK